MPRRDHRLETEEMEIGERHVPVAGGDGVEEALPLAGIVKINRVAVDGPPAAFTRESTARRVPSFGSIHPWVSPST
jgi:hypothetical protein